MYGRALEDYYPTYYKAFTLNYNDSLDIVMVRDNYTYFFYMITETNQYINLTEKEDVYVTGCETTIIKFIN